MALLCPLQPDLHLGESPEMGGGGGGGGGWEGGRGGG